MRTIQELQLSIDELTKELEHTKNEKAKCEMQIAVLTEERDQLTKELKDSKEAKQFLTNSHKVEMILVRADRDGWHKSSETKAKDLASCQEKHSHTINELSSMRQHVAELESERDTLKEEKRKLKENLDHITSLNTTHYNEAQAQVEKVIQLRKELAEMTEARDTLAAVLETKTQAKVFYKGSPDTDWIPLGTGHVTLEFKTASTIRGSDQPLNSDFETVVIDDPQYTSHSVRKYQAMDKDELVKLCTRQARELNKLQEKWKTHKDFHIERLSSVAVKLKKEVHRLHRHLRIKESLKEFPKTQQILGEKPTPEEIEAFNRYNEILRTEIYREREDNANAYRQLATMADRVKELYEFLKKQQEQTEAILHPQRKE